MFCIQRGILRQKHMARICLYVERMIFTQPSSQQKTQQAKTHLARFAVAYCSKAERLGTKQTNLYVKRVAA